MFGLGDLGPRGMFSLDLDTGAVSVLYSFIHDSLLATSKERTQTRNI